MRTSGAAAALACVLLAGCSGDGGEPTVLPRLTATPSHAAVLPAIPLAARAKTVQGADAFVRFYFERLNEAFRTSDGAMIRAYSDPKCATCENYARSLDAAKAQGHFLSGDSFSALLIAAAPLEAEGTFVEVNGRIPSRRVVNETGHTVKSLRDEGPFHFRVAAVKTISGWLVRAIKVYA